MTKPRTDDFVKQLDHYQIELSVIGEGVDCAFDLASSPQPRVCGHGFIDDSHEINRRGQ